MTVRSQAPARSVRVAMVAVLVGALQTTTPGAQLTSPEPLVKAYDLILDARFDQVDRQLQRACGPAPEPACDVLGAVSDYWEILLDPEDTSRDADLLAKINRAIASTETWVEHEPGRAEAWFYMGGAYGTRVLLRGLRSQYVSAARDGKRIHNALQRAIALDATLIDANFGLGLYHYYAAIAPRYARILRILLLLPAGDRAGGLKEMEQTRTQGMLLRGEADYQLHLIYSWYERKPMTALPLAEALHRRYPHNPVFALRLAAIQSAYLKNHQAALQIYGALLEDARGGRVAAARISEVNARLGMAHEMDALCRTEDAIGELRAVIAQKPAAPYGALARAHHQLGRAYDRAGRRDDAVDAYRSALAANPADDRLQLRNRLRDAIRRPPAVRVCR
jgi:tetratricopeptide (TPR) repeat protein